MAKTAIQMITSALAKQYKLSVADATAFVDAIFTIVSSELKNGKQVKIKGLGTFKVQSVKPRESVNVNTGERVLIKGHDKITFTPDTAMKELVNKPFSQFETVVINDGVNTEELERVPAEETTEGGKTELADDFPFEGAAEDVADDVEKTENVKVKPAGPVQNLQNDVPAVEEEPAVGDDPGATSNNISAVEDDAVAGSNNEPIDEDVEFSDVGKEEALALNVRSQVHGEDKEGVQEFVAEKKEEPVMVEPESLKTATSVVQDSVEPVEVETHKEEESPSLSETIDTINDEDGDIDGSANGMLKRVALIAVIVIACLGVFLWVRFGGTKSRKGSVVAEQVNSSDDKLELGSKTVPADTVTTAAKARQTASDRKKETVDSFAAMNSDPRIRYGAYNIIGIDRVVVLKKGQTMEKYSRKTLGADMIGYFQVLNGRKTMQAGDTMKVPKVELRPEYRK
ncbi:HU family DNA-binding protein [Prevotella fusca]|uniref:HU family DNA-binding protein n=1 Tax=Prevotella fusca JCM 17724 TaxID=1236517 RepID=A0A0K1NNA5_9BACT|nr:HU family DNA-binding protein [Prevotella fusca]AKU70171.1 integration host factor subunit alpha [Prevotella fusca JCM 17724]QUB85789.1 HU family DNA-binding protein [Prevotella fusca JCM 17724]